MLKEMEASREVRKEKVTPDLWPSKGKGKKRTSRHRTFDYQGEKTCNRREPILDIKAGKKNPCRCCGEKIASPREKRSYSVIMKENLTAP